MNVTEIQGAIEAVLFSLGDAIQVNKIAEIIEIDKETVKKILQQMSDDYMQASRGIQLVELNGSYQLCTKKEFYEYVKKATNKVVKFELTDVVMETLSIIAYKQPITKAHIENIRGVKSDHSVNKLVEFGLVEEIGRMDTPGRPILFGTTEAFLRSFGLSTMDDLPMLREQDLDNIKHEVEEEMQLSFDNADTNK